MPEDRGGLCRSQGSAALPPRDGGEDLDCRDVADEQRSRGVKAGQGTDPLAARLVDVAFDQGTGIQEIRATSPPLADDRLRKRFAFDGDGLVVGVVEVLGGVGELRHQADIHQVL